MKPVFGVELDDSSHQRNQRVERDEFIESVCEVAGLPLLRFPAQRDYDPREISSHISPFLKENVTLPVTVSESQQPPEIPKPVGAVPLCPKCGIPMVLRIATKGENKGKQFYGCQNYPQCREVKSVKS
jgi:hypothetical protein